MLVGLQLWRTHWEKEKLLYTDHILKNTLELLKGKLLYTVCWMEKMVSSEGLGKDKSRIISSSIKSIDKCHEKVGLCKTDPISERHSGEIMAGLQDSLKYSWRWTESGSAVLQILWQDNGTGSLWDFLKISAMERSLPLSRQNAFASTHYQIRLDICPIYKSSGSASIKQSRALGESIIIHLL